MKTTPGRARRFLHAIRLWFDTGSSSHQDPSTLSDQIDWVRVLPFVALHLACLGVIWVGVSWIAVAVAAALYAVRMFAITGFYHRYFSHKAFKTSRLMQALFGLVGADCDVHSPVTRSLIWSHMGWFLTAKGFATDTQVVKDLRRYPELVMIDRFDTLIPIGLATALFLLGGWLEHAYPELGTSAGQMLVWGFFISTTVLFHATVTINSLAHRFGSRRFETRDNSRNNLWLALITFGEGWHNNHHHFPGSARQGFHWWEIDLTYYVLKLLAALGLVWDLKPVPAQLRRNLGT